jgi:hypothetical protein
MMDQIKKHISKWGYVYIIVALFGALVYSNSPKVTAVTAVTKTEVVEADKKAKEILANIQKNEEPVVCPPSNTAIVLESKDDLLKNKKWFVVDLNEYEVTKVKKTETDKTVYFRQFGKKKIYITITEENDDVKYTNGVE